MLKCMDIGSMDCSRRSTAPRALPPRLPSLAPLTATHSTPKRPGGRPTQQDLPHEAAQRLQSRLRATQSSAINTTMHNATELDANVHVQQPEQQQQHEEQQQQQQQQQQAEVLKQQLEELQRQKADLAVAIERAKAELSGLVATELQTAREQLISARKDMAATVLSELSAAKKVCVNVCGVVSTMCVHVWLCVSQCVVPPCVELTHGCLRSMCSSCWSHMTHVVLQRTASCKHVGSAITNCAMLAQHRTVCSADNANAIQMVQI